MHFPMIKKTFLEIHTKLSMCRFSQHNISYQEIRRPLEEGEDQRSQDQTPFLHNAEDQPLRFHSEYNKHALLHIQTDFTVVGL
ncbi:unnamed protein product, partial [Staurois parvus]